MLTKHFDYTSFRLVKNSMVLHKITLKEKLLLFAYSIVLIGLFLYSLTQIDLSLALSRLPFLQSIVTTFQQIGYFNRPLSTGLFLLIIILMFGFYITFLVLSAKKKLRKPFVWTLIGASVVILTFSYNAFSYDLFNYIFDAKIVTNYHENPYVHKALDYPQDPMLSFMRWTHRVYPYGPVWLGITVPLSFVGMQYFLPTLIIFKLLMSVSFILCLYFIGKIFQKIAPEKEVLGLVFLGLNPLILIESLVSAHNDIVMMAFALWAVYLLVINKYLLSYVLLFVSIGIKFISGFLLPVFVMLHIMLKKKKHISWEIVFSFCLVLLIGGVVAVSLRTNFQPWYLVSVLTFAVFLTHRYYVLIPSLIISFFALLNYAPFLYVGNWDKPIPQILSDMNFFSYSLSFFVVASYFCYQQILFAQAVKKSKKKWFSSHEV